MATSPTFAPIAIVGRACTLPGALSPEELWAAVASGRDLLSAVPVDRWGVGPDDIMCDPSDPQPDRTWSDRGGYVEGFDEVFDPEGFGLPSGEITQLDPVFQWTLHTARAALHDAGLVEGARVGAVLGNLSFPSAAMARFAESVWWGEAGEPPPDPRNRFSSGLPALLLGQALGLEAGAFALDAACASSLYAVKYACDWLHDGRADVVLAGAVNSADDLFIHVGFSSLAALSRTGQSRPFHADADGLVPAEGAAFVALKRLEDAERDNDRIHGVIRGVGLSNDGRGRGFLVPSTEGQVRAIRSAYEQSGLDPSDISLLECHATGTRIGDATELASIDAVFDQEIPVGSLKSNLGHLITVAGVAGLIKVTEAMEAGVRPPTLHAEHPVDAAETSSARILTEGEPWQVDGVRRAAVSAFGFGGNNAHLIVEQHTPSETPAPVSLMLDDEIAIVGVGVVAAGCADRDAFTDALLKGGPVAVDKSIDSFEVDIATLGMPPKDLERTLPQQLLMLDAGSQAAGELDSLPRERTGVFVGMGVDAEVARYGARWRSTDQRTRDDVASPLESAGVIGTMPNIVANRLNRLLDVAGPSCTVSAEELSGLEALELAVRGLRNGELDAAVVGAVDLSCEPVHSAAARAVLAAGRHNPGDAAVAVVVKRLSDAEAAGDHVYATVQLGPTGKVSSAKWGPGSDHDLTPRFGHAHCASGLLHLVAAAVAIDAGRLPDGAPWLADGHRLAEVHIDPMLGVASAAGTWTLAAHGAPRTSDSMPIFWVYEGADTQEVVAALAAGRQAEGWRSRSAPAARLVIVARDEETLASRFERARQHLLTGAPPGDGVHYRATPIEGDIGFVFASAGTAYEGMGTDLVRSLPEVADAVQVRFGDLIPALTWTMTPGSPTNTERLWGASAISRLHVELTIRFLGIHPQAAIGYSSGETTSLFALGVWTDLDSMRHQIESEGLFDPELGGSFDAVARAWGVVGPVQWAAWNVLTDVERVRSLLIDEPRLHLAIIHTSSNCVIAGDAQAARRVVELVGPGRCHELEYNIAAHVPEVNAFDEVWLDIHRRQVTPVPGVRFYSAGYGRSYEPSPDDCAKAIFAQATDTLDFPVLINQAWDDGVRIFIEHGPQGACSGWIREILGDRQGLVVALDRKERGTDQILHAMGALLAASVTLDTRWIEGRLGRRPPVRLASETRLRLPAHPKPVRTPRSDAEVMAPAPLLPSVIDLLATFPLESASERADVAVAPPRRFGATPSHPDPISDGLASPSNGSGWQTQLARISEVHQQFLAHQAAVHQRFLAMRAVLPNTQEPAAPLPGAVEIAPGSVVVSSQEPRQPDAAPIRKAESRHMPGFTLDRSQVEIHASGAISEIFGPSFIEQDANVRQVRMPEPPLLLVDRVTGIDAEPGVQSTGTIWTETDILEDSWYLHRGRMPAGILIESGQADLMLISYMGADLLNKSERVYRLLGCQLTFEDDLPAPGDTLSYEIHVDGHAKQNDIRLFFFHYDCTVGGKPRIKVRNGQAGFFSDEELADSGGVLWSPEEVEPCVDPRLDPPVVVGSQISFDAEAVRAFAGGRPWDCFGPEFDLAKTHTRTPTIQTGDMLLIDSVTELAPTGGPWGRGYLRAEAPVSSDDWFFAGHFKNDSCMPGTLMFEGCLQALSFTMAGLGFTLHHDGWRFQTVTGEPIEMVCRGQVTPSSRNVVYEVFVEEIIAGPRPTIYADLLCTVDGQKAFHARRVGLQLVPDWPLGSQSADDQDHRPVASVPTLDGEFEFGYPSLLACAWGKPSDAFGPMYARFDGPGRVPRLPGPPYHFLSRVTDVTGPIGGMEVDSTVDVEYDIPQDAWYFDDNGVRSMPFAVLLEAALQPCGWLASYIGSALTVDSELAFRNLDGAGTVHEELFDYSGTLSTHVELTGISQTAGMIIVNFIVACTIDGRPVFDLTTVFGFFPPDVLEKQVGLSVSDAQRLELTEPCDRVVALVGEPSPYFGGTLALGNGRLRMLDQVTGFWPEGGTHGLGRLRAERHIDVGDWYFKSHFFQDPVQPGSLGIEAMIQLLQFYLIESGVAEGITNAQFEPLAHGMAMSWRYRGQVVPTNDLVHVTMDITDVVHEAGTVVATATASLWCDGIRIYSADNLGVRVISGTPSAERGVVLDPAVDTWLGDHRPTWNRPALPMMSMVDMLAKAVPGDVIGVSDVRVGGWVDFVGPRQFATNVEQLGESEYSVRLMSEGAQVASAVISVGSYPKRPEPLVVVDGVEMEDPYISGRLFHGPAFRLQIAGTLGADGASTVLDSGRGDVPIGRLHPGLLDAALHGIPHDQLHQWADEIGEDRVAFPVRIAELRMYGPTPTEGMVRCEVRFDGFLATPELPRFSVQLITDEGVWATFTIIEACLPKGPIGSAEPGARRSFLADHIYVPGLSLSEHEDGLTRLDRAAVASTDWMPGTVLGVFGTDDPEAIAVKDHLAYRSELHPFVVPAAVPLHPPLDVCLEADQIIVSSQAGLDLDRINRFWAERLGVDHWLGQDLTEGLVRTYVRDVVFEDPVGFDQISHGGAIFVANHQVQLESILVTHLLPVLLGHDVVTMANAKHATRWVGWLIDRLCTYPGAAPVSPIVYFDQAIPNSMADILSGLRDDLSHGRRSLLVHAQGTRSLFAPDPVTKLSSTFLDLAVRCDVPIVPVRFSGGLSATPLEDKLEIPLGAQDYVVGGPITPDEIASWPYGERRRRVLDALNNVGGRQVVTPTDAAFEAGVESWSASTGARQVESTFIRVLEAIEDPSPETLRLLEGAQSGELVVGSDPVDAWLAEVAGVLYGPDGPRVRRG